VWLLTGDKRETAINIGFSSKLLNSNMTVHKLSGTVREDVLVDLKEIKRRIDEMPDGIHALVVNGDALAIIFEKQKKEEDKHEEEDGEDHQVEDEVSQVFLQAGTQCRSVICCRVTPLQKALVVKLVKSSCKCITLAIGGLNEVVNFCRWCE
jgi:phospholipid-transporting ATPase